MTSKDFALATAPEAAAATERQSTAAQIHQAETDETMAIDSLLAQYWRGGAVFVPEIKEDHYFALVFKNFNSFGLLITPWKHKRLNHLIRQFKADFVCGVELQTNWLTAPPDKQFEQIIGVGKATGMKK